MMDSAHTPKASYLRKPDIPYVGGARTGPEVLRAWAMTRAGASTFYTDLMSCAHWLERQAAEITRLRAELSQETNSSTTEWQPISSAPHDGTDVILAHWLDDIPLWVAVSSWLDLSGKESSQADDGYWHCEVREGVPTHWMPCPAAPKTANAYGS